MFALLTVACHESQTERCRRLVEKGSHEDAVRACEQAFEATGDPRAGALAAEAHLELRHHDRVEEWPARLRGSSEEARAWELTAISRRRRDQAEPAREAYLRACALYEAAGKLEALALNQYRLFHLSWEKSRYREALRFAARTLELATEIGDRELITLVSEGLFALLIDVGDLEGARRALTISKELAAPRTASDRSRYLSHAGLIRLCEGRYELARHTFERALREAERADDSELLRFVHLNMVDIDLRLGLTEDAREHLEAAIRHADSYGRNRVALHNYRAHVERAQGCHAAAAEAIRNGLESDPPDEWAWELEYQSGLLAEARGDASAAERAFERSCSILERMRTTLGFGEFKSWHLERKRDPFEALFIQQVRRKPDAWKALETIERVRARVFVDALAARSAGRADGKTTTDVVLENAADRIEALQSLMPILGESFVGTLMRADQLARRVGPRHVLVYFKAREWLWLMHVSSSRVVARRLSPPVDEIRALIDRFVAAPDDQALAAKLGGILLPGGATPRSGEVIHVVTDTLLERLPFAALRRENRYLVENHVIVNAPSLNALNAVEENARGFTGSPVVLGDPLGDLPAAAQEARDVGRLLGVAAHLGSDATASKVIANGRDASVLHLATHGDVGARGHQLRFSDRPLTADEVIRRGVASRLVVLASCASATRRARGIASPMATAFLAAGSRAVVASLWSLPDHSSRRFLMEFYRRGGARDPARALARSQRGFIDRGERSSFWSAFIVMGAGAMRKPSSAPIKHGGVK